MASTNVQTNNINSLIPALQPDIPGPLIVSDSAVVVWNNAVETAQYHIQNRTLVPPVPFPTTVEEKCWVTLMALRKEEDLQEMSRYLENVTGVFKLLYTELVNTLRGTPIRRPLGLRVVFDLPRDEEGVWVEEGVPIIESRLIALLGTGVLDAAILFNEIFLLI
ncbi:hypothetical protein EDD22DRAFT_950971 [Suillus occidentalis]|nr:hypothetical protein EDD22DRAFT_950971 [Suillus occidentalis]